MRQDYRIRYGTGGYSQVVREPHQAINLLDAARPDSPLSHVQRYIAGTADPGMWVPMRGAEEQLLRQWAAASHRAKV